LGNKPSTNTLNFVRYFLPARLDSGWFVDRPSRSYSTGDRALTKINPPDENLQLRRGVAEEKSDLYSTDFIRSIYFEHDRAYLLLVFHRSNSIIALTAR
jgi:hypothetical protein